MKRFNRKELTQNLGGMFGPDTLAVIFNNDNMTAPPVPFCPVRPEEFTAAFDRHLKLGL